MRLEQHITDGIWSADICPHVPYRGYDQLTGQGIQGNDADSYELSVVCVKSEEYLMQLVLLQ